MKPFLLTGVLLLSHPTFSQTQTVSAEVATEPSGYGLLLQAGDKILPGPNGGASNTDPMISPEENLKRERLAVARNAPALALVQLALQRPISLPETKVLQADTAVADVLPELQFNARARELARQFSQESDVRFADGDYVGAMNSKLDTLELGAVVGHGTLISMFVGAAVEAIGANKADKVASHLDATQCRAAVARLVKIEGRRTTLAETLRQEQKYGLRQALRTIGNPKDIGNIKPEEDGTFPTAQDIAQLKALTPAKVTENYARLFDAAVETTVLPYPQAISAKLPTNLDPLTTLSTSLLEGARYRYNYERTVAQTRLLRTALELRAQKLESGVYPETFTAPVDPFSSDAKPLVYRKTAQDYLLYSVGPDTKDDGGAEIQMVETDEATGVKTVTKRLRPESTGDMVQAPF